MDKWPPPDERPILDDPWPDDDETPRQPRDRFSVVVGEALEDGLRRDILDEAS